MWGMWQKVLKVSLMVVLPVAWGFGMAFVLQRLWPRRAKKVDKWEE